MTAQDSTLVKIQVLLSYCKNGMAKMLCARKGQAGAHVCQAKLCEGKLMHRKGTTESASQ